MTTWTPTHRSKSDGSTVRLLSVDPHVAENEDGERFAIDPDGWERVTEDPDRLGLVEDRNAEPRHTPEYRIIRGLGRLPYGCGFRLTETEGKRTVTMEDMAHNIEQLVKWFETDREVRDATYKRLMRYEGAIAGLGNFLDVFNEVKGR